MTFTANYELTDEIQRSMSHDECFHVTFCRKWWLPVAALVLTFLQFISYSPLRFWFVSFGVAITVMVIAFFIVTYFTVRKLALQAVSLLGHRRIEITVDDAGISLGSANGIRHVAWENVNRRVESPRFVFLLNGDLFLAGLPKTPFSEEALTFIREESAISRRA